MFQFIMLLLIYILVCIFISYIIISAYFKDKIINIIQFILLILIMLAIIIYLILLLFMVV
nr:MAG TPA: hypothetical protein [Crassvirales sp.]